MSNVLDFQVNGLNPSTVGGTGTSVKYFQRILGTNGPNSGPNTNISATNAAGALFIPAAGVFNGQQFDVLASGDFGSDTGDPSGTVTVQMYVVTGTLTSPVFTSIATTGAITPTYPSAEPWSLSVSLIGTTSSGLLTGNYTAQTPTGVTAPTTITANIAGLNFSAGNTALVRGAVFGLVVGVTFGTSNATNTANMYEFTVEN